MSFAGLAKEDQLGDILLYLRSLSENPIPLPAPLASAKNEQEAAVESIFGAESDFFKLPPASQYMLLKLFNKCEAE